MVRSVRFAEKTVAEVLGRSVRDALRHFEAVAEDPAGAGLRKDEAEIAAQALREIVNRLGFLDEVGVGYLTLDRPASTLSGGEAQRIRLATQGGTPPLRGRVGPGRALPRGAP